VTVGKGNAVGGPPYEKGKRKGTLSFLCIPGRKGMSPLHRMEGGEKGGGIGPRKREKRASSPHRRERDLSSSPILAFKRGERRGGRSSVLKAQKEGRKALTFVAKR